jgi:hypothetical protein
MKKGEVTKSTSPFLYVNLICLKKIIRNVMLR